MKYSTHETDNEIVLSPEGPALGAVIWLHGLGADGYDFVPIVTALNLPQSLPLKFIFPNASVRPITLNRGYPMRAWYDITGLAADSVEDEAGIRESETRVREYIAREEANGIDSRNMVLAGFSQGSAIAIHTALRYPRRLAGLIALSGYLPQRHTLAAQASAANKDVPIFMAHGQYDAVVPYALAEISRQVLHTQGFAVSWHSYPMAHEVSDTEIADIARWLATVFARSKTTG